MAANSAIEWTDQTWNPVVGCSKVSPGCAHCYAETMAARLKGMALADIAAGRDPGRKRHYIDAIDDKGRWSGKLIPVPEALDDPDSWRKPRQVFVNSMSDLFHESILETFIAAVFTSMRRNCKHTYQVLTKRARRMAEVVGRWRACEHGWITHNGRNPHGYSDKGSGEPGTLVGDPDNWPLRNVWLGVSCEDQKRADERIPWLLKTPAAVRFLSCEPLLGPIDLSRWMSGLDVSRDEDGRDLGSASGGSDIDWVIVGGESGHDARPCDTSWVRSIVRQCRDASVPCFVKQMGSNPKSTLGGQHTATGTKQFSFNITDKKGGDIAEWPEDLRVREFPRTEVAHA
jgi:protein gp37